MKKRFENRLIRKLIKGGCFDESNFDREKRTVNLGLFGMAYAFCDARDKFRLSLLQSWYKYKLMETRYKITTTFLGETFETVI